VAVPDGLDHVLMRRELRRRRQLPLEADGVLLPDLLKRREAGHELADVDVPEHELLFGAEGPELPMGFRDGAVRGLHFGQRVRQPRVQPLDSGEEPAPELDRLALRVLQLSGLGREGQQRREHHRPP
jgi:hypothetical protein